MTTIDVRPKRWKVVAARCGCVYRFAPDATGDIPDEIVPNHLCGVHRLPGSVSVISRTSLLERRPTLIGEGKCMRCTYDRQLVCSCSPTRVLADLREGLDEVRVLRRDTLRVHRSILGRIGNGRREIFGRLQFMGDVRRSLLPPLE